MLGNAVNNLSGNMELGSSTSHSTLHPESRNAYPCETSLTPVKPGPVERDITVCTCVLDDFTHAITETALVNVGTSVEESPEPDNAKADPDTPDP